MRQLIHDLLKWQQQAKPVALATVIHTWGSAPRGVGSTMAISAAGEMLGSVSGGCVEGAVVEAALSVLESGQPRMLKYGVADETAWEVGLACGGSIEIFVRPFDPKQLDFWQEDQSIAVGIVLRGPESVLGKALLLNEDGRSIGALTGDLHARAVGHLQGAIQRNQPAQVVYLTPEGDPHPVEFFIHLSHPAPTLIIIGGVHIAVGLVSLANTLGYSTVIIDPRRGFGIPNASPTPIIFSTPGRIKLCKLSN